MSGVPRYDDKQVALILERAAELQARGGSADSRRMSMAEVEAIAGEAGIDAALVRQAARELSRPAAQAQAKHPLLGAAASLHFEARIAGELSSDSFDLLLHELRSALGEPGTHSRTDKSMSWQTALAHGQPGRRLAVTVTVVRGETLVRVDEQLQNLIGGLFGGLLGGLGGGGMGLIALPIVFAPWSVPLFVGGWLGGTYLLTRRIYKRAVERREQELRRLLARLVDLCEENLSDRGPQALPPAG
ncbi:MAG: hypothetical protein R6X02_12355 [Enhygromyxa sp.]